MVKISHIYGLAICHLQSTFTHMIQLQIIQVSLAREGEGPYGHLRYILEPNYFKLHLNIERKSIINISENVTTVSTMYYQNAFYYMWKLLPKLVNSNADNNYH